MTNITGNQEDAQPCPALDANWGTTCTPLALPAPDWKMREINCANSEGLFRIIQSIPSPKAEPFKPYQAVQRQRSANPSNKRSCFLKVVSKRLKVVTKSLKVVTDACHLCRKTWQSGCQKQANESQAPLCRH